MGEGLGKWAGSKAKAVSPLGDAYLAMQRAQMHEKTAASLRERGEEDKAKVRDRLAAEARSDFEKAGGQEAMKKQGDALRQSTRKGDPKPKKEASPYKLTSNYRYKGETEYIATHKDKPGVYVTLRGKGATSAERKADALRQADDAFDRKTNPDRMGKDADKKSEDAKYSHPADAYNKEGYKTRQRDALNAHLEAASAYAKAGNDAKFQEHMGKAREHVWESGGSPLGFDSQHPRDEKGRFTSK